jgi:copper resistance protein C
MIVIRTYFIAGLMCIALSSVASAHAHLLSAEPGDGAVIKVGVRELKLNFSEGIEAKLSGVVLTASGKGEIVTGAPAIVGGNDNVLIVPLAKNLDAGTYTVNWHALSKDGHTSHHAYTFSVEP